MSHERVGPRAGMPVVVVETAGASWSAWGRRP